jgi:hypothetical protein
VATLGQLLVDGNLVGSAFVGQSAGDQDRAAERHTASRIQGDRAELPVPAGRVGWVGHGQDERPHRPPARSERLADLGQGGHPAAGLDQVVGRARRRDVDGGVYGLVDGQEAGQRRLGAADAGGRG